MTTSSDIRRAAPASPGDAVSPGGATLTEDAITVLFSLWFIAGGATDVWAHTNRLAALQEEGFITPWHILAYSGFLATAGWTFWLAFRRRHLVARWWRDGWPAGYRAGAIGAVFVMAGGFVDGIWHTVFGIESDLNAKLSPSHNVILFGAMLLSTSPLRSWWQAGGGGRRAVVGVTSMAVLAATANHVFPVASALASTAPTMAYAHDRSGPTEIAAVAGLNSYLLTTATLLIPFLLAHRRRATPGAMTAVIAAATLFEMIRYEFPRSLVIAAVAAIAAAAVADLLLVRLDSVRGTDAPLRLPIAGGLIALLIWPAHLLGLQIAAGVHWPVELWTGAVTLTVAFGAVLGGLVARPASYANPRLDAG